jgi:mRNA (guanine-N7-)-methyltransferase
MPPPSPPAQDKHTKRFHPYARTPATEAQNVASHYNARPDQQQEARKDSRIFKLRAFNNWIKAVLIAQVTRNNKGLRVLDMGCGKGGDLLKWKKAGISEYVGVDIASVSVQRAEERYREMWTPKFDAEFHTLDCFGVSGAVRHNGW